MKMISWNVNGLRAAVGKGFMDYFNEVDADIFSLQETKLQEGQIELATEGYINIGTMLKKKDIRVLLFLLRRSPCQLVMELVLQSMIWKEE